MATTTDRLTNDQQRRVLMRPLVVLGRILAGAITAEILIHDWLFNSALPGLGLAAVVAAPGGYLMWQARRYEMPPDAMVAAATGTAFGLAVAVWASPVLQTINVVSAVVLHLAATDLQRGGRLLFVRDPLAIAARSLVSHATETFEFVRYDLSRHRSSARWPIGKIALGAALAIPVLVVFGALFAGADAQFAVLVQRIAVLDLPRGVAMALPVVGLFTIVGITLVRRSKGRDREAMFSPPPGVAQQPVVALTILVLVDALFALFVATQGFQVIASYASETTAYAQQARNGFFELVTVGALVVGLLLVLDWLGGRDGGSRRRIGTASRVLVGLTVVVLVSAVVRMSLYVSAFGLTELRFYSSVFMVWIGATLLTLWRTVTYGKREQFIRPTIATALVLIAFLNLVNPDARIAQLNQRRTDVDVAYLQSGLSEDAARATGFISCELRADGFRSWNLSRHLANQLADPSCTN